MDDDLDFDQTQAVVLDDIDDDLTDEMESSAEKKPAAYIRVLFQKGLAETTYPLYEGDNIIGRQADTCHVCIPSKSLSKEHACVQIIADSHLISDKNSRNKTRRGKLFLRPEVWYELKHGDEILFADVRCNYEISQQVTETVAETDSEASESLLLHHDVTEEHSFDTADKQAYMQPYQKPYSAGIVNIPVPETQVFSESEDEDEKQKKKNGVVHETLLFDDSDPEASRDGDMFAAATQAYTTEDQDEDTCGTQSFGETSTNTIQNNSRRSIIKPTQVFYDDADDEDSNEATGLFAVSTIAFGGENEHAMDTDGATQTGDLEAPVQNTCKAHDGANSGTTNNNSDASEDLREPVKDLLATSSAETVTQIVNVASTDIIETTQINDGGHTQIVDGVSTQVVDGTPSRIVDEAPTQTDNEVPTQISDEAPTQTDKEGPTQISDEASTQIVDKGLTQIADEAPTQTGNETLTQIADETSTQVVDETLTQTADEAPTQIIDETTFVETSSSTSQNVRSEPESSENISTQIFVETESGDSPKSSSKKAALRNKTREQRCQLDESTKNATGVPSDCTLAASEKFSKRHLPIRGRGIAKQQAVSDDHPTIIIGTASDDSPRNLLPDNQNSDLTQITVKQQKIHKNNKDCKNEVTPECVNELCKTLCVTKCPSEELTQIYGIEEDICTQTYDSDNGYEAADTVGESKQFSDPEDADATQIFMDSAPLEKGICADGGEAQYCHAESIQILEGKGSFHQFDIVQKSLGRASGATTENVKDMTAAGSCKASDYSDDDSDLDYDSVLKSDKESFDVPTTDDSTSKIVDVSAILGQDLTVEVNSDKLPEDQLLKAGNLGNNNGDGEELDSLPDTEEMVPDSMTDDTDARSPPSLLPFKSPMKPALLNCMTSPSSADKQSKQSLEKGGESKAVESRRKSKRSAIIHLEDPNEVSMSPTRLQRTRNKKVTAQYVHSKNDKNKGEKKSVDDKSETKPASGSDSEQKVSEMENNEEDFDLGKCERQQKPILNKQNTTLIPSLKTGQRRKTVNVRTENIITAQLNSEKAGKVSESHVPNTRTRKGKILKQDAAVSRLGIEKDETIQSVIKNTRKSAGFKRQVLVVADVVGNGAGLKNMISDCQNICISGNNNMALAQSEVEKENNNNESDETVAASVKDKEIKVDVKQKEKRISENRKGRRQTIEKTRKEDLNKSEIAIVECTSSLISSRGRHISANPYLKDFETGSKTDKRRVSILAQGEGKLKENKVKKEEIVSDVLEFGKRKRTKDVVKPMGEESNISVGPPRPKSSRLREMVTIETSQDDIEHSENNMASKFENTEQNVLNNTEIKQDDTPSDKPARGRRKGGESRLSGNMIKCPWSVDSFQGDGSDMGQSSKSANKRRSGEKNVTNYLPSDNMTPTEGKIKVNPTEDKINPTDDKIKIIPTDKKNKINPTEENLLSNDHKSSKKGQNPSSRALLKTQNIVTTPEFQNQNMASDENQHQATIAQPKGRGRKSLPATSATSALMESKNSSVRSSRSKRKTGSADDEAFIPEQAEAQPQVSESPTKKSKLLQCPKTPVGKTDACQVNTQSPALRKSSTCHKPRVMFTGLIDEHGEKIVKDLGGEMASSIQECTHLVTDRIRRTVKFLSGLAKGLLIVSPRWLESCKQAGTFIDGRMFLVSDPSMEKQYKFNLGTSITKAQGKPMLTGYKVHVSKSVKPDPVQMQDVLKCAGAEYLRTMPSKPQDNTVVVSCHEDHKLCQPAIKVGIRILEVEFILTGILRQELDFETFALSAMKDSPLQSGKGKTIR